jgi:heparan sulfate N-deacetylase/N-sulfotransferase NDST2
MGQEIIAILEATRMRYKVEVAQKSLPNLTHMDKGRYGVVIFERLESYLNMDNWNRQLLDKYCRDYNVGIIAFAHPDDRLFNAQVKDFPLFVHSKLSMRDYQIKAESPVLRITRGGEVAHGIMPGDDWTVFVPNHTTYEPIACAKLNPTSPVVFDDIGDVSDILHTTIIRDRGEFDGIQRVIFGNSFKFWLHRPLFLDVLSFLSHGKLSIPLDRHILIDIDDIFVGKQGTRMKPDDVMVSCSFTYFWIFLVLHIFGYFECQFKNIIVIKFSSMLKQNHNPNCFKKNMCTCGSLFATQKNI